MKHMEPMVDLGPDALIMADPGLIMMVRERWPNLPVHLSVQANTINHATVKFWHKLGLKRIILSRELSLDELQEIRQECPGIELESFVHGALCMAYSGRCLLSGYLNSRDSNQGNCTNACRWDYKVHEATESSEGIFLLEEIQRPGEYLPVTEDEHGTYIMNSKDLRAVEHVQRLVEMGIDSLKIEGRTKSHYYIARTTRAYRRAIDDARAGKPFDRSLLDELACLSNRGYTDGFYTHQKPADTQNYERGISYSDRQKFVGEVLEQNDERILIDVKNNFGLDDALEFILPDRTIPFTLEHMQKINGDSIDYAPGNGHKVSIAIPELANVDARWGLLARNLTEADMQKIYAHPAVHKKA